MRSRFSLAGKLALVVGADLLVVAAVAAVAAGLGLPAVTVFLLALLVGIPLSVWSVGRSWGPVRTTLEAVTDGVRSFHENDFSVRLAVSRSDELGDLVQLYNRMAEVLRVERNEIYQRELLLDTVLQGAPLAIVLVNELGRVVYANSSARRLLGGSKRLQGRSFTEVLAPSPEPMKQALESGGDGLFTWASAEDPSAEEIYRVVTRAFHLNTQRHRLVMIERITPELRRQEVEVWKKVIRVLSHELNNSLAPISSMVHSAQLVASRDGGSKRLNELFGSIDERVRHLCDFLEGYARFARLPKPRKEPVNWREFLESVRRLFPFRIVGEPPADASLFDRAQMQQVLINLLKNAAEAGSPPEEIALSVDTLPEGGTLLRVFDRGKGMDEETMRNALLPFYSSKQTGTGLGLPLCTEILSAHGGKLTLQNRTGGGTIVCCLLPAS
ncbi:MAG TPA: ATP-binding protein [Thermoanaerobaculia bacterium]